MSARACSPTFAERTADGSTKDSVTDPAIGLRFEVTVDGIDIGSFTGCEGLGAEYEVFEYQEGGENGYVHRIPGRLKYTPVKLTRPLDTRSRMAAGGLGDLVLAAEDSR